MNRYFISLSLSLNSTNFLQKYEQRKNLRSKSSSKQNSRTKVLYNPFPRFIQESLQLFHDPSASVPRFNETQLKMQFCKQVSREEREWNESRYRRLGIGRYQRRDYIGKRKQKKKKKKREKEKEEVRVEDPGRSDSTCARLEKGSFAYAHVKRTNLHPHLARSSVYGDTRRNRAFV